MAASFLGWLSARPQRPGRAALAGGPRAPVESLLLGAAAKADPAAGQGRAGRVRVRVWWGVFGEARGEVCSLRSGCERVTSCPAASLGDGQRSKGKTTARAQSCVVVLFEDISGAQTDALGARGRLFGPLLRTKPPLRGSGVSVRSSRQRERLDCAMQLCLYSSSELVIQIPLVFTGSI